MRWRIHIALVLALFVAVSRQDTALEPLDEAVAESPSFNLIIGPENPGKSGTPRSQFDEHRKL
jgi:hypothetical protein